MNDLGGRALRLPPADRQMRAGSDTVIVTRVKCMVCGDAYERVAMMLHQQATGHAGVMMLGWKQSSHAR